MLLIQVVCPVSFRGVSYHHVAQMQKYVPKGTIWQTDAIEETRDYTERLFTTLNAYQKAVNNTKRTVTVAIYNDTLGGHP
jgi:hypothetical protein